jgi:hypothetical protein
MRQYVPKGLLWLFVVNLGIALGAGVYEQRVVVLQWKNIPASCSECMRRRCPSRCSRWRIWSLPSTRRPLG